MISVGLLVTIPGIFRRNDFPKQPSAESTIPYSSDDSSFDDFEWSSDGLYAYLPKPPRNYSRIIYESEDCIQIEFDGISQSEFISYVTTCKQQGFSIDSMQTEDFFWGYNIDGLDLCLTYLADDEIMEIMLDAYPQYLLGSTLAFIPTMILLTIMGQNAVDPGSPQFILAACFEALYMLASGIFCFITLKKHHSRSSNTGT